MRKDRRRSLRLLGGAFAVAALPAFAQPSSKIATIGLIAPASAALHQANLEGLRQGLREHGYVEGRNLRIEARYAEGKLDRVVSYAEELAKLPADVIVTAGSLVARVVRKSTRDVPIVMAYAGDPVGGGLADSLSRPGGRITGLTTLSPQLAGKRLEILKEILPKLERVGVVWNPEVPERVIQFRETQAAAAKLQISLHSFEARKGEDVGPAMKLASGNHLDALIVMSDGILQSHGKRIVQLAASHRLPTLHQEREGAELGGLMSYGPSHADMHRRAAVYVDKILKGAKPGDLPIEQPTKFELILNLKTAKALGITIPQSFLVRADEVIQ
ncbi:MAG TPA: ABC transporter substrate-binding protein [Burkholderiales bacterium]|nr:ABC transporter substrate-binding protein [Burkholderiales bacterium]